MLLGLVGHAHHMAHAPRRVVSRHVLDVHVGEAARILRGKHKPVFAPHMDMGDHVIIINADKIVMTRGKADRHMVYSYSGYPGGLKSETYSNLLARRPDEAIRGSVRGMLPKGPLGRQMIKKLKVYAGAEHPHGAQNPKVRNIDHAKAR